MENDDLQIRRVVIDDAFSIAPLLGQLGYPADSHAVHCRLECILPDERVACWVADSGEKLLGLSTGHLSWHIELDQPIARMTALVVDEHARGQGVAQRLAARFEGWARENGVETASLNSGDGRSDAHAFYEKLGWRATGRRFVKKLAS